ncbi:MAG: helix-turn-helix domain-containing protein [bacterium]|jgi:transcriptional regulator with XRE-family HTH domain
MDVQDRILEIINYLGFNAYSFAKELNIDPSTIHKIVTGRRSKPSIDVLLRINSFFPKVNLHWVLTGIGPMIFPKSESEKSFMDKKIEELVGYKSDEPKTYTVNDAEFNPTYKEFKMRQEIEQLKSKVDFIIKQLQVQNEKTQKKTA